jgi:nickel/cobalt transporter (NicO) family protein
MTQRLILLAWLCAGLAAAHPMGNFSVNHYARLEPGERGVAIHYVMDLAEIPTFEMFQQWGPDADPQKKALDQAREWAANLEIAVNGKRVPARVVRAQIALAEGAGNMQVARITADLQVDAAPGTLTYEDRNYQGRSGWKEIVGPGGKERSAGLTAYPQDPMVAPPQELKTVFSWTAPASPVIRTVERVHTSAPLPVAAPAPPAGAQAIPTAPATAAAPGQVVKGDYLSRLLHRDEIGWQLTLIGMAVAFGLGAMHAMSPGHGKTIVAAYLVGSRGTFKHAMFLGAMVTFTHTVSVFLLGFVTLFLSKYVLPEKLFPVLGAISGLSIVWVGTMLFFRRLRARGHHHHHDHDHAHGHAHGHDHHHDHGDGHSHSHVPEGEITMGSLIALGASGGLVPCPSALVVLLSAISLGRVGLGMLLLVGFSAGLAVVLMGMGVLVLCVGNLLPASQKVTGSRAFKLLPVASAALIACVGLVMTGVSLGLIRVLPVG